MIILAGTIVLIAVVAVMGVYYIIKSPPEEAGRILLTGLVLMAILVLLCLMISDKSKVPYISPADRLFMQKQPLPASFKSCRPPEPGFTDILVFVISTQSDKKPLKTRCDKISKRFMVK